MAKTKKELELEIELLKQQLLNKKNESEQEKDELEIKMTKLIPVVSLYHGNLNLKTTSQSDATIFTFNFFGYEQPIFYNDLIKCINNQRRIFTDGFCYINNKEVVQAHYLDKAYEKILDKDSILNFINQSDEYIKNVYENLPIQQKITVIETVAFKLNDNENVDRNKIDILAGIANVDIYELANKLK